MSQIRKQTQMLYRKVIFIELGLLLVSSLFLALNQLHNGLSFFFGSLSSVIPQIVLIGFVFFREKSQYSVNKTNSLYQGEGLKFVLTILLMVIVFVFYQQMNIIGFFAGFLIFLCLNILLPLYLLAKQAKNRIS